MAGELILIVEDERKIAELLQDYLKKGGYETWWLSRGDEVLPYLKQHTPALMLLDLMLPGMDGLDICREIRKTSTLPIIMITAKVEEADRLIGLEIGADDYICKPFSPREAVARVRALLRRRLPEPASSVLTVGPISLDETIHQATVNGIDLDLTPNEFRLLGVLMSQPHRVFSRATLLDKVQGYRFEGYDRTIDSHIKNLRKKVSARIPGTDIIVTVYGMGYKFVPPDESPAD